jgi:hypothetical protein
LTAVCCGEVLMRALERIVPEIMAMLLLF